MAIHLPENLDLSPEGSPTPVQWFFSSGFDDGVDRVTGLRLSVGLYRDKSHYPHMLSTILTRVDDTTPSPSDPFTSFIFGGSVGGCPVFLPGPELPMGAVKVEKRATTDDLLGPREFNQRALIELYDGRFVEIALDGLPDVVLWSDQARIFNTMVESVR